jgi:hypothetical protein
MIYIKLNNGQTGYDAVGEYIRRYWEHNIWEDVVVSLGVSYDGETYDIYKEVASPYNFDDIEYLNDWWEGQEFIKIFGVKAIRELDIEGGLYER